MPDFNHDGAASLGELVNTSSTKRRLHADNQEQLAGGFKQVYYHTTGDGKYLCETYRTCGYNQNEICQRCEATKAPGPNLYTNFGPSAGHKNTTRTVEDFYNQGPIPTCLCNVKGWHPHGNRQDWMHGVYQGLGQNIAANTIVELLMLNFWGSRMLGFDKILARAWKHFRLWCKQNHISCSAPKFTRANLSWESRYEYPTLKGKAWNCRVILAWLASVCSSPRHATHGGPHADLRRACVVSMADVCNDIEANPTILAPPVAASMADKIRLCLVSYAALAKVALLANRTLYQLKPKMHGIDHVADDLEIEHLNPKRYWNFANEDFVGKIKRIARKAHNSTMATIVVERYLLKIALRWTGRDTSVRKQLEQSSHTRAEIVP